MSEITVTDSTFEKEVMQSDKPVLVDFWAVWCQPCKIQDPILEEVVEAIGDKAKIAKMNVDENPQWTQKFMIMSIPTIMIFKGGQVVKQFIGVQSKETLLSALQ